jgi:two-component system cell cycle sensor histidine kinase/response regulator CckA
MFREDPATRKHGLRVALGLALAFLVVTIFIDLISMNWLLVSTSVLLGIHLVVGTVLVFFVALLALRSRRLDRNVQIGRLQSLLVDQTHDSIITTDEGGWITTWNKGSEHLFGYTPEEAIGRHVAMLFPEGLERHKWLDVIAPTLETGSNSIESSCRHKSGKKLDTHIALSILRDDRGQPIGMIGHLMDITDRKRGEEVREHLEAQLRQAQKMEAIGKLAGGVAHDFNNLLAVIIGYSELLLFESTHSNVIKDRLHSIASAGHKAAALTRQLLAFSRKQVLQPVVVDLNALLPDLQKMLSRLINPNIRLMVRLNSESCLVKVDPSQLEQVVMNLVVNARDAMPEGGELVIETLNVIAGLALAEHEGIQPGEYSMLAVRDTGCGMDPATQAHIFEPFFTTKALGEGTGLGLATVHGIVEQSGGHVVVETTLGQGSTFKVYLPQAQAEAVRAQDADESKLLPRGSETILLVEDEENVRSVTRDSLSRRGYTVLEARNGEEAMQLSRAHNGVIHLLMTDMIMPGISTRLFTEAIFAQRPGIAILYMSGFTDALVQHGIDETAAFLQKPFTQPALAQKVRERLDRNRPLPLRIVFDAEKEKKRSLGS